MLVPLSSAGQVLQWANVLGVSGESMIEQVRTDALENVYVLGHKANSGSVDLDPGPGSATLSWNFGGLPGSGWFIAKYDSLGDLQWGYKMDMVRSIDVSPSGETALVAYVDGAWDADPGPGVHMVSGDGGVVIRLSTDGMFQSAMVFQGAHCNQVLIDDAGEVHVLGQFVDPVDIDPGPDTTMLISNGYADVWMARLDAADSLIWAVRIGGTGQDLACDLAFAGADLLLTLRTIGNIPVEQFDADPGPDTAFTTFGQHQAAAAIMLDPWGGYMDHASFDWPVDWRSPLIRPRPDKGIVLAGSVSGSAVFVSSDTTQAIPSSGTEGFIHTLGGSTWAPDWTNLYLDHGYEVIRGLAPVKDSVVLVSGIFTSALDADPDAGTVLYQNPNSISAAWVGAYCLSDGAHLWSAMVNGPDRDGMLDLAWSEAGALVIGGQFSSGADLGLTGPSAPITTTATSSAVVARYTQVNMACGASGVAVPELVRPDLEAFIAGDRLVVDGLRPGEELRLFDGLGRLLEQRKVSGAHIELAMSGRSPGVYLVLASSNAGGRAKRLVHQP
jgi:hypothetical protein